MISELKSTCSNEIWRQINAAYKTNRPISVKNTLKINTFQTPSQNREFKNILSAVLQSAASYTKIQYFLWGSQINRNILKWDAANICTKIGMREYF